MLTKVPNAQRWMIALLAAAVILANIAQPYPEIAPLQHVPTVALLLAAPFLLRRWPLSNTAVACILVFFLLHTLGGRYAYSNLPYDQWSRALAGVSINEWLGTTRNHYDRLVHFAFGLLAVPPVVEAARRHAGAGPRLALFFAFLWVMAIGGLYEIFEWLLTLTAPVGLAEDYNGQQGDPWDAQKDMALAALGAFGSLMGLGLKRR